MASKRQHALLLKYLVQALLDYISIPPVCTIIGGYLEFQPLCVATSSEEGDGLRWTDTALYCGLRFQTTYGRFPPSVPVHKLNGHILSEPLGHPFFPYGRNPDYIRAVPNDPIVFYGICPSGLCRISDNTIKQIDHSFYVDCVSISCDGRFILAVTTFDHLIVQFDTTNGFELVMDQSIPGHPARSMLADRVEYDRSTTRSSPYAYYYSRGLCLYHISSGNIQTAIEWKTFLTDSVIPLSNIQILVSCQGGVLLILSDLNGVTIVHALYPERKEMQLLYQGEKYANYYTVRSAEYVINESGEPQLDMIIIKSHFLTLPLECRDGYKLPLSFY
jgi:hypothetical protein